MRNLLGFLLGCGVLFQCAAAEPAAAPPPGRVVTSYALTSVQDFWDRQDPSAWRLWASHDGQTWALLDVRTNQPAAGRSRRRVFPVANQTAYPVYRLQVDGNVDGTPQMVALAEVELMGPVVGVSEEAALRARITASQPHPMAGAAANAFDQDPSSRWMDYAPFRAGCWLQCEYVRTAPEHWVTNVDQAHLLLHLNATPPLLLEKGPQILSHLTAASPQALRPLRGYALTSANDAPERDPRAWRLLGSNDGGKTWQPLDARRKELFSTRFQRRYFALSQPARYRLYRLEIDCRGAPSAMQLAEVEPVYADSPEGQRFSLVISASSENPPIEKTEMAFDGDPKSKWLAFTDDQTSSLWIQWQDIPEVEGLPLINYDQMLRLLDRRAGRVQVPPVGQLSRTLRSYALTSANDWPSRDPRDWRLLGSQDAGQHWVTLDERHGERFPERFQQRSFQVSHPGAFALYRLEFSAVADPTQANSIQLASIEPAYAAASGAHRLSTVISARGENAPGEGIENAFDGSAHTKWLDFSDNTNRSSWVQWYFAEGTAPVVRADAGQGVQPDLAQVLKLQLEGVAVWVGSNALGILDQSGFQLFALDTSCSAIRPGDRVRLNGQLRFGGEWPRVQHAEIAALERLPRVTEPDWSNPFAAGSDFALGVAEGQVVSVSEDRLCTIIRLEVAGGARQLQVKMVNPEHQPLPISTGCHLRAQGVLEPVYRAGSEVAAGVVWVAGSAGLTLTPSQPHKAAAAKRAPAEPVHELTSLRQVAEALKNPPAKPVPVRVRGIITYIDLGQSDWFLQAGTESLLVSDQQGAGLSPFLHQEGLYVELQGLTGGNQAGRVEPTAFVKVLGKGEMPEPLRHSLDYLMSGNDDNKWVQLEGIVTVFDKQRLTLSVNGGQLVAWINETDGSTHQRLLGSRVRVSGVCSAVLNSHGQRLGVRLLVPAAEQVEVLQPSPEDPFALPTRPLDSLLRWDSAEPAPSTQLVKISGVVTYREPRLLFLQHEGQGVRVLTRQDILAAPGDVVEAVGLAEMDGLSPRLTQAVVRKIGVQSLPAALPVDLLGVDPNALQASWDATRGAVEATLLGYGFNEAAQVLELKEEKTGKTFCAFLPFKAAGLFSTPVGSRLHLEGVFKAKTDPVPDFGQVITSFELFLNSPADVVVLARPPWWTSRHTFWLLGGLGTVALLALAWVGLLRTEVRRRTHELKEEIAQRKRMALEVEHTHKQLLAASRLAGMAEVATSVLHNVGNVLNSVNVAAGVLAERLRQSSGTKLARVVTLMNERAADLGAFITQDPKGRQIPAYLGALAEHLDREQSAALVELDGLKKHIEHINNIVAMQQAYARVGGVTETIAITELVEDALSINTTSLRRLQVELLRDYAPDLPPITVDKHKVLQILVNLIRNAKDALEAAHCPGKQIRVRVSRSATGMEIAVSDNGVGIPPENLTRIFSHGFTTRKNGHGFGLHSGALAAKEMGGTLLVHSDGPGGGATFTLQLPLAPATSS